MKMNGEQRIAAPKQRVWDALNDPEILKRSIAGCQSLEKDGDDRMRASVAIKIGPMDARLAGAISLSDLDPPHAYTIHGQGQGAAGSAKGSAKVRLVEEAGATTLFYEVDTQVGGRLAQLGGPIIDATARQLAGSFFKRFGDIVAPPASTAESTAPVQRQKQSAPGARPPSTMLPTLWIVAVAAAAVIGFLIGRTPATSPGQLWMALAIGLFIVIAVAKAFDAGRRSASPVISLDASALEHVRRLDAIK